MSAVTRALVGLLTALLLLLAAPAAHGQDELIDIEVGKSKVKEFTGRVTAIAITDPTVARVQPLASTSRYQIQGVAVGSTDLIVTIDGSSRPLIFEIAVHRDLSDLIRRIDAIVEGEPPRVYPLGDHIVVQGPVDDLDTLEQVAMVAAIFDPEFVNLMSVRGDHQVQLEVVFAETSRSGLREIGFNFALDTPRIGGGIIAPGTIIRGGEDVLAAQRIGAPFPGAFNLIGTILRPVDFSTVLAILDDYRLTKTLAQPTSVVLSGQQAEFLAGGEIPVPAPGMQGMVLINFKEYGVRLSFVPTVLAGDVIDLRVYVEVSQVDYSTTSRIVGLEVPGFISRKSRSHVRLGSGMTFAMAGLLQESTEFQRAQIPLLGDLPIVGTLFRYLRHRRDEKEMMIFVTPRLVRPLGPGEVPAAPGTTEDNNTTDLQFFLLGLDRRPGSRTAEPAGLIGLQR
jgi:pilus assembly protein CpaC